MPPVRSKRRPFRDWAIYKIGGKKAKLIGHVAARDKESAVARGIVELDVPRADQKRIVAEHADLGGQK